MERTWLITEASRGLGRHLVEAALAAAKVAAAVVRVAAMDDPPLRLLLGADAYDLAQAAARRRAEEDARWEALSRSTDLVAA